MFSKKSKVPPIFKSLTSEFKERLRFGFVSSDKKELVESYKVDKFPTVIVLKSYDNKEEKILDKTE